MMAGIRAKNTTPEIAVRKALFAAGFRFRVHRKDLPGNPDIVLSRRKVAIFVHGYFWHQHPNCRYAKMPKTNQEFWAEKLRKNVLRDQQTKMELLRLGWRVLVVWECLTRSIKDKFSVGIELKDWIDGAAVYGELSSEGFGSQKESVTKVSEQLLRP